MIMHMHINWRPLWGIEFDHNFAAHGRGCDRLRRRLEHHCGFKHNLASEPKPEMGDRRLWTYQIPVCPVDHQCIAGLHIQQRWLTRREVVALVGQNLKCTGFDSCGRIRAVDLGWAMTRKRTIIIGLNPQLR